MPKVIPALYFCARTVIALTQPSVVVFITSNYIGNSELMEGCKEAGIPAFGTLWDFVSVIRLLCSFSFYRLTTVLCSERGSARASYLLLMLRVAIPIH